MYSNEIIDRKHFDYEKGEEQARELEERISKVSGMTKYLKGRRIRKMPLIDPKTLER